MRRGLRVPNSHRISEVGRLRGLGRQEEKQEKGGLSWKLEHQRFKEMVNRLTFCRKVTSHIAFGH